MSRAGVYTPAISRVWRYVVRDEESGCWLWRGTITKVGYGTIFEWREGQKHRPGAHRVVYEALVGPIPEGLDLDHLCRVRNCVNPSHLEPVTRRENLRRGVGQMAEKINAGVCLRCGEDFRTRSDGHRFCLRCSNARQNYRRGLAKQLRAVV